MVVGKVIEIWRYPVKSMAGGMLRECQVTKRGIPGDRGWAIRDEEAQEVRGAKKFPVLLQCRARYLEEPDGKTTPPAEITFPDGERIRSDDPKASSRLSSLIGKPTKLAPVRPPEDLDYYRRRLPEDPGQMEHELRQIFGRLPNEPLPDLSIFPPEILEFTSPLGTHFDAFPLHLLTTSWLEDLGRANPGAHFDRRRFRPNFLIELQGSPVGKPEAEWCDREVRLGEVRVKIEMPVVRCVMTTLAQDDLPKDSSVLRTIVWQSDQNVGVYASPVATGRVKVGDPVELV
ncbi:MAG: MOSC domain-containing protein [Candidatus Binatia bacterium]